MSKNQSDVSNRTSVHNLHEKYINTYVADRGWIKSNITAKTRVKCDNGVSSFTRLKECHTKGGVENTPVLSQDKNMYISTVVPSWRDDTRQS